MRAKWNEQKDIIDSSTWSMAAPAAFLILWSSGFVFLKIGLKYSDPLTFLALRYACVIGLLMFASLWIRPTVNFSASGWLNLVMVGLFLQAGYFSFTYLSLKYGLSAGAAALTTSQQPILIGLFAPVIAGEQVGPRRWIGLVLGVTGAAIVILSKASAEIASPLGLSFAVLALISMSCGTLWEKRFGATVHPIASNFVQYAVGLAVVAPLALALEPMHVEWTLGLIGSLTYLVLGNSILAISLFLALIRRGEASRVSALFFLVPPMTAIVAFVVLGESLPMFAMLGICMAAAGIFLVMRKS
jgi:drug/metabolite transporter (DMT)-like permease